MNLRNSFSFILIFLTFFLLNFDRIRQDYNNSCDLYNQVIENNVKIWYNAIGMFKKYRIERT
nr:MAG TPA: hypothetical protein [Caudoviricetes sp.]